MTAKLIVLDVDDTLYLESDYVLSGFKAVNDFVLRECGVDGFFDEAWRRFQDGARRTIFNEVIAHLALPSGPVSEVPVLVTVYRRHRPSIVLLPDALQFLNGQSRDTAFAVVTDGPAASQRCKVEALSLSKWTDEIVVTDERGPDWFKPSPTAFRFLQERSGVKPSECVYIGDNPLKDFVGPRALGWATVRVRRERGLHAGIPDRGEADYTVESFGGVVL